MRATITGRLSDRTVQGLRALGVVIRFLRFDYGTGLPVHQFTTGGVDAEQIDGKSGSGAAADYRALGAGRGSGSGGRGGDVAADRPAGGGGRVGGPDVRPVGVAAAGQGSSDFSQ